VFIRVYRLETQSVMLVFSTPLCELCPSNLLFGSPPPPPPPCVKLHKVCDWQGVGVSSPLGDHILYLTRFRTYKIVRLPQTKNEEERGPQTDKHLPQSTFTGKLFKWRHFALLSISLIFLRLFLCFRTYLALWLLFFHFSFDLWIKTDEGITSISTVYSIFKIFL
jgi:hypothetical protein